MRSRNMQRVPLGDEEIVALYWARNEDAIKETDYKYGSYLYTIANNILRNDLDSEECLNDTYLGTWNAIPPQRPTMFQAFLSKIMRRIALGRVRKSFAAKRIPSELVVSLDELDECMYFEEGEDEKYLVNRLGYLLNAYLNTLSERRLFIFVCRYYYSDPVGVIAGMLKLSENTVLRDLAKIRQELKDYLEKEGYHV